MAAFLARKFVSVACWGPRRGAQVGAPGQGMFDGAVGRYSLGCPPEGAYPPGVQDGE